MPDGSGLTFVQRRLIRQAQSYPRADLQENYAKLVRGAVGRVVEVGCGTGNLFAHYPGSVSSLVAIERNAVFRAEAVAVAANSPRFPIVVTDSDAEGALPVPAGSADTVVLCEVLCSAKSPAHLLAEVIRVLRPGGELRIYEHEFSTRRLGRCAQRSADLLGWPRLLGGCHAARDITRLISRAGFIWTDHQRLWWARPQVPLTWVVGPHVLGTAVRPSP